MEIFVTSGALDGNIVVVDAAINVVSGIATEIDTGRKHLRDQYEVTLEAATAEVNARIAAAIQHTEQRLSYLRGLPRILNWAEQGKPKFRLITG
jgi:hypothetical protein